MSFEHYPHMAGAGRGNLVGADEGGLIELPGWQMRVKVSASDTAGHLTLLEARMAAGHSGPSEHIHIGHDEAFFVVAGSLKFRVGDGYKTASCGETVFASRGLAHGFSNPSDQEARYLVALTPSGYEFFFERLAATIRHHGSMPNKDDLARMMVEHGTYLASPIASPRHDGDHPTATRTP